MGRQVGLSRIRRNADAEPIAEALSRLPPGIRRRVAHTQWVAGVDPVFTGLTAVTDATYGRSYRDTAHALWPCHLEHRPRSERVSTVVLPAPEEPWVIIHELGHVLHETIEDCAPIPAPVSAYAQTNDYEAFAEAFTAWLCPVEYRYALRVDDETLALFDELAR